MSETRTAIASCGTGLPRHALHNRDIESFLETSHDWIQSRTGISERRVAGGDEDNHTLSLEASRAALEAGGYQASDIDLVIVASTTVDRLAPSMACSLQGALGATGPAFDLNAGCSGFIYSLTVANSLMRDGLATRALIVGTETLTRLADWRDRSTCVLFGDGAGAAVVDLCGPDEGMIAFEMGAYGEGDKYLKADGGGSRMMASLAGNLNGQASGLTPSLPFLAGEWDRIDPYIRMDGKEVFRFAVSKMSETLVRLCGNAGITPEDIDIVVPHQANERIIEAASRRVGLPLERFFMNMERYANTSAASIPIALDEAMAAGAVKGGDLVALVGFGAGLTWAGTLVRWPKVKAEARRGRGEPRGEEVRP